jgi:hypothetical protein
VGQSLFAIAHFLEEHAEVDQGIEAVEVEFEGLLEGLLGFGVAAGIGQGLGEVAEGFGAMGSAWMAAWNWPIASSKRRSRARVTPCSWNLAAWGSADGAEGAEGASTTVSLIAWPFLLNGSARLSVTSVGWND